MNAGDLDPDRDVYYTGSAKPLHLQGGCRGLRNARRLVTKEARYVQEDRRVCRYCEGGQGWWPEHMRNAKSDVDNSLQQMLEEADPEDLGLTPLGAR